MKVDLAIVARDLKLPPEKIEKTVELLDAGNTIPFITRFRKDLTGGLNEQQILAIKQRVAQLRALAERKAFVLKSIESQGKLTDELKLQINKATTSRRLEDYYLPFKPKKQSRASLARQQGLEPLAEDIFSGASPDIDLATRSTEFVRVDKGLTSVDDVIKGVGDLLTERFSENDELRATLRKIMWNDGKLESQLIVTQEATNATAKTEATTKGVDSTKPPVEKSNVEPAGASKQVKLPAAGQSNSEKVAPLVEQKSDTAHETPSSENAGSQSDANVAALPSTQADDVKSSTDSSSELLHQEASPGEASPGEGSPAEGSPTEVASNETVLSEQGVAETGGSDQDSPDTLSGSSSESKAVVDRKAESRDAATSPSAAEPSAAEPSAAEPSAAEPSAAETKGAETKGAETTGAETKAVTEPSQSAVTESSQSAVAKAPEKTAAKPKKKKKKKKKKVEDPFSDYRDFKQPLKQIPNHQILAINRGERAGNLKVKIKVEGDKLTEAAFAALVPADHPSGEFLQKCASDALARMIIPSLEREIRRELTEAAEKHAVEVFANNLRNLLLQPPIRNRVVLAIDPGFKRGCSVAVLDACGNLLDSGHTFVVGNQNRRQESKQKIVDWVNKYNVDVIAIGNGAACRQTEQMVSDVIGEYLKDNQVQYVMVNEAGASIYSTSEIGREELPNAAPSIRSAVSIGRRLQDPLSELVKISPANIGVGMYQHDVKAKHLSESLDDVVEFCVNRVGVNVNSASPSLLKYVSGLNALTARRVVEYRQNNGQFKNREELKQVNGFGEATFVQAAGFLRVHGGDRPLDCTSIHPESYEIANDILKRVSTSIEELFPKDLIHPPVSSVTEPATTAAQPETTADQPGAAVASPATKETEPLSSAEGLADNSASTTSPAPAGNDPALQPGEQTDVSQVSPVEAVTAAQMHASQPDASPAAEMTPIEPVAPVADTSGADAAGSTGGETPSAEPEKITPEEAESKTAAPAEAADPAISSNRPVPVDSAKKAAQREKRKEIHKRLSELDVAQLAADHSAGVLMVRDILMSLKSPKWDPRDKVAKPIFRRGIIKSDDLKPGMQLDAQVVNVVDFGVFVDIGLGESSLVHVSQLSNQFVRDPHRICAVGDVLKVWVSEVDSERRRVKLTAIRPGAKKNQGRRRSATSEQGKKPAAKYGNKYGGRPKGKRGTPSKFERGATRRDHGRKAKPKPVKPITDEMLKGNEPMRSFSDLAQFVSSKPAIRKDGKKTGESGS